MNDDSSVVVQSIFSWFVSIFGASGLLTSEILTTPISPPHWDDASTDVRWWRGLSGFRFETSCNLASKFAVPRQDAFEIERHRIEVREDPTEFRLRVVFGTLWDESLVCEIVETNRLHVDVGYDGLGLRVVALDVRFGAAYSFAHRGVSFGMWSTAASKSSIVQSL